MRLTVPIAIAATFLAFSANALPTIDRQQPFLPQSNFAQPNDNFRNQKYNGHQVVVLSANSEQELSALDALRQVSIVVVFGLSNWNR